MKHHSVLKQGVSSVSARPQRPPSFHICSLPRPLRRHTDLNVPQQAPERASCFLSISAESTLLGSVTERFTLKYLQTDAEFANILNMYLFRHLEVNCSNCNQKKYSLLSNTNKHNAGSVTEGKSLARVYLSGLCLKLHFTDCYLSAG